MASFVLMKPDAFRSTFIDTALNTTESRTTLTSTGTPTVAAGRFNHVRRPVRGIQIKEETYATIQVRTANGQNRPLIDAGGFGPGRETSDLSTAGRTDFYSNFLLQRAVEVRSEKAQIVETFGSPYVFFYGERPRVIDCVGVLLNTEDFNWRAEWWHNYENELRGTRCVQHRARVYLSWDDIIVEGYMMESSAEESSEPNNLVISFNFKLFVTNYINMSSIGDTRFPTSGVEVQLSPNTPDTTGDGIGNLRSSTLNVRELNQAPRKNSLLQGLRDGVSAVLEIEGVIQDALRSASSFLFGREVRVPIGFTGAAAFDEELFIKQTPQPKTLPGRYGHINENLDEYVALRSTPSDKTTPIQMFEEQLSNEKTAESKVREIYRRHGIRTDPPNEVVRLVTGASFGVLSVVAGSATLGQGPSSTGRVLQALDADLLGGVVL